MNKFHFFSRAILILCSGMIASQFAHATTGVVPSDNDSILAIQPGDRIVLQNQLVLSCKAGDTQVSASSSSESNGVDVIMIEDWQPPKKPCRQSQVRIFEPGEVLYVAQAIPSGGPDEDYIVRGKSRYFRVLRAVPNGKSDSVAYERYSLEVRVFGERDMQTTTIGDLRRGFNWAFYITH